MADVAANQQLVKMARDLERKRAARRKVVAKLTGLDDEIRVLRKHIRDLTTPDPTEAYQPMAPLAPDGSGVPA
jgi:hypothetical protein